MKKKVNRKTNKIRQVIDDKKNIKCSGKKRSKKNNRFEKRRKRKIKTYVFDEKKMIRDNFFSFSLKKKFSPITIGERNNSLINLVT
jgi:hypothetical protein